MNDQTALETAIKTIGNQSKLARVVGVTPQAISHKLKHGTTVPAEWCAPIEEATEGKITRHQLRPDLFPEQKRVQ